MQILLATLTKPDADALDELAEQLDCSIAKAAGLAISAGLAYYRHKARAEAHRSATEAHTGTDADTGLLQRAEAQNAAEASTEHMQKRKRNTVTSADV